MRLPLDNANDAASVNLAKACDLADLFMAQGFSYFDTAYMYHGFKSEEIAREAIVKRYPREQFQLTTKMPVAYLKEAGDLERYFGEQLQKCGVSYFDYYLLHSLDAGRYKVAQDCNTFAFIQRLKQEGKARHIGFSYHGDADLLRTILAEHPEVDVVQIQLNYLDWNNDTIQSKACYDVCAEYGKPVIVMEPVKGGMLANLPDEAKQVFKKINSGASMASWALRFAGGLPGVMMVLSGMSTPEHVKENMTLFEDMKPLAASEMTAVEEARQVILSKVAVPCTGCGYCVDGCPQRIPIPQYFSLLNAHKRDGWQARGKAGYDVLADAFGRASDCVSCGTCEAICPQHLVVPDYLRDVSEQFEE